MPRKFDQDAKDRVIRLVEDRILAENLSVQVVCELVAPKLRVLLWLYCTPVGATGSS